MRGSGLEQSGQGEEPRSIVTPLTHHFRPREGSMRPMHERGRTFRWRTSRIVNIIFPFVFEFRW